MSLTVETKYLNDFVTDSQVKELLPSLSVAHEKIISGKGEGGEMLGWRTLPYDYDKVEFERIKVAAAKIMKNSKVLVVIGIGGSYLGARAVIEFIKSNNYNLLTEDAPQIFFAGNTVSASALAETVKMCEGKDFSLNVISKSGTTTEPAIAFRVFRDLLEKKYGKDGAKERIFVTTDKAKGTLKNFADKSGYETFVVPDNIGGRYSVLSAVGLLPIACAGIDIDALMSGARKAADELTECDIDKNPAYKYAVMRNALHRNGKDIEIMVSYEPSFQYMNEWWKQLYGESEGKENKGIFPTSVINSTDLHSLGQIVQEGRRNIFETVVSVEKSNDSVCIKDDPENIDGLNFLSGKELDYVNKMAFKGTIYAHVDGGVPNIVINVPDRSEASLGYLIYFFELACAASGYILGVNPFNQPGVEAYKINMFGLLGKPGYEEMTIKLEERMQNE